MANQLVSSSSFSSTPSWRYDVFLSFRGEDTRTNFTDHLYHALIRNGINTFIDCHLTRGEEISSALLQAIEESRISIIVLSEKYVSSRWCLDELVHILECRKSRQLIVWPVFYKVDPSHVRNHTGSFGEAFTELECKFKDNKKKILAWRSAVKEAANLSGYPLKKEDSEATLINKIVKEILVEVLQRTYLNVAKHPVGIHLCVQEVKELLGVGGNGRVVGIWGTSGIGKTTIAKAVYNAIAHVFQGSCFLADVRELSTSREGVIQLQKTLLSKILCGTELNVVDVHEGISLIKKLLRQKKVLLILDDVDEMEQLNNLVQVDWFGEGSRVIITTKDRGLLKSYGVRLIYKVQKLQDDKALELLSLNAFGRNEPPDKYFKLAQRAIAYAEGLPLALNLIGSHLHNKSIDRWQDILDSYDAYEGEPYRGIQRTLRKSYDAWDNVLQQIFLDIACFFKGADKDYVLQILRSSKLNVPQDCIEVLVENAIITIEDNRILMHDLLEKMGKHIVYEESPTEPGKRSRLWFHEDVYDVLTKNWGTWKIKGIVVKLPKTDVIPLNAKSFLHMVNLEIFINLNARFYGRVDYLPNDLRWIELGGQSDIHQKNTIVFNLPSNYHPRHLVRFDVSYSGIRQLKEFKNLAKLTWMNLSGCKFLEKFPDISGSPNIKHLNLSGCQNLVEVDDSIGFLDKLVTLDLSRCSKLTRFATRLGLQSLEMLFLCDCTRLERFPEIEEDKMKSLTRLEIGKSGIRELPSSIAYLTGLTHLSANGCELQNVPDLSGSPNLKVLDLSGCSKLTRFATRLGLRSLEKLNLWGCTRLETFPEIEKDKMESLHRLEIGKSGIRELPSSIAYLTGLTHLSANGCELQNVPDLSGSPNLEVLDLTNCTSLVEVHDSVGFLDELQGLHLDGCSKLTRFVTRLGSRSLLYLSLEGCRMLESFPEIEGKMESLWYLGIHKSGIRELPSSIAYLTGLTHLSANGCELQNVPDLSGSPNITHLDLSYCKNLVEVDNSVGFLDELQELNLSWCSNLTRFPTRLGSRSLRSLSLEGCRRLKRFPEIEKDKMKSLMRLEIGKSGIRELPSSIAYLTGLTYLSANGCKLQNVPDLSGSPNIRVLDLNDCTSLVEVHDSVAFLDKLKQLDLTGCYKLARFATRLKRHNLCNCYRPSGDKVVLQHKYPCLRLRIFYPGNEVPKWFNYTSNHPTTVDERDGYDSEFRFEIPLKLQVGEPLVGLALSFVLEPPYCSDEDDWEVEIAECIFINGVKFRPSIPYHRKYNIQATHVLLWLVDLWEQEQQGDICQVVIPFHSGSPIKSCGVHCLLRNQDELLHSSLRPTSSLGKRPRPCGSSDIVDGEYDQQQQWLSSSSEPAEDHPKRRQIDPNVPIDIEEDEEQEPPSASDDPQFLIY
ncbi:TMV resistance protein N-like isoform X2 [Pyrus x bretschneideri]|uniref:TMV resistance protein N-like isoform X2 n=1 Tax=Pyrus x bretschneideri TaxID=225117 RepID=UPI00202F88F1|nr:TMV resistance protein N-like isoform X2 [Pyrus x bretschneideri]